MKTWAYLLIMILGSFTIFASNIIPSFADDFLPFPTRLTHGPIICALEPKPDSQFPDLGKKFLDQTQYAVIDWALKLNQGMGKHPAWNLTSVSIPLSEQANYDYSKCDITVNFLPKPDDPSLQYALAGYTIPNFELHKSRVEIYYLGIETEVKKVEWQSGNTIYYQYVYYPHYTGFLAADPQLEGTIRHEIGHALGLGHYVVPYDEIDRIVHGLEDMPSIMIPTETVVGVTHFDITPLDISQMKATYGYNGFGPTSRVDYTKTSMISFDKSTYSPQDKIELSIKTSELPAGQYGFLMIQDSNNKIIQQAGVSNQNSSSFYLNSNDYQNPGKYYAEFEDSNATTYDYTSFTVTGGSAPPETEIKGLPTINPTPTETSEFPKLNPTPNDNSAKCFDLQSESLTYKIGEPIILCGPLDYSGQVKIEVFGPDKQQTDYFTITLQPHELFSVTLNPQKYNHVGQYGLVIDRGGGNIAYGGFNIIPNTEPTSIPSWVKNNAKWWSEGSVGDGDFVKGMQYLVQQGIVKVTQTQQSTTQSQQIPAWIKNNAGWWASGQISDDEFLKGIQFLISSGIIKV